MLKWTKLDAGEYQDTTERFSATKTWDRIYGDHWVLIDAKEYYDGDNISYKGKYDERTLLDCKLKAEALAKE